MVYSANAVHNQGSGLPASQDGYGLNDFCLEEILPVPSAETEQQFSEEYKQLSKFVTTAREIAKNLQELIKDQKETTAMLKELLKSNTKPIEESAKEQ